MRLLLALTLVLFTTTVTEAAVCIAPPDGLYCNDTDRYLEQIRREKHNRRMQCVYYLL